MAIATALVMATAAIGGDGNGGKYVVMARAAIAAGLLMATVAISSDGTGGNSSAIHSKPCSSSTLAGKLVTVEQREVQLIAIFQACGKYFKELACLEKMTLPPCHQLQMNCLPFPAAATQLWAGGGPF